MTPRAKSLFIALSIALPCLAYTAPCFGHNGRDEGAPESARDAADETYKAGDIFSCIEVSKDPRTGVRTYTQTCDIPHDPGQPSVASASEPMAHGVDFWVDQSFADHGGGNYASAPPAYADSGYSDGGYSDSYVSDGYYGYGGGYLPLGDYGGRGGRPGRGHGHGGNGGHGGDGDHGGGGNHGGGGVGIPVRPGQWRQRPGVHGRLPPAAAQSLHCAVPTGGRRQPAALLRPGRGRAAAGASLQHARRPPRLKAGRSPSAAFKLRA
jgi:hypothetical protein